MMRQANKRLIGAFGSALVFFLVGLLIFAFSQEQMEGPRLDQKTLQKLVVTSAEVREALGEDWLLKVPPAPLPRQPEGSITAAAIFQDKDKPDRLLLVALYWFERLEGAKAFYIRPVVFDILGNSAEDHERFTEEISRVEKALKGSESLEEKAPAGSVAVVITTDKAPIDYEVNGIKGTVLTVYLARGVIRPGKVGVVIKEGQSVKVTAHDDTNVTLSFRKATAALREELKLGAADGADEARLVFDPASDQPVLQLRKGQFIVHLRANDRDFPEDKLIKVAKKQLEKLVAFLKGG